jgi:hypothetical protein
MNKNKNKNSWLSWQKKKSSQQLYKNLPIWIQEYGRIDETDIIKLFLLLVRSFYTLVSPSYMYMYLVG